MLNIAILVTGEFRDFKIAHRSWPFKKWDNVDFFFSTWTYSIMEKKYGETYREDVDINLIMDMSPVDIIIDTPLPEGTPNLLRMINRWHAGFDLIINQPKQYDAMIMIRPDFFNNVSSEDYYDCVKQAYENTSAGILYTGYEDYVFDTMFIFSMPVAIEFMKYDFESIIKSEIGNSRFNIHRIFAEYFRSRKTFCMPPFFGNYATTRENARELSLEDQLDFHKVGQLAVDWYLVNPR